MKCNIYARFSPRPDAAESESIAYQVAECRAYAERHSMEIVAEFCDRAMSGADPGRPGLWAAIDSCPMDGAILVHKFDRFARSPYIWHDARKTLGRKRAVVVSASGEPSFDGSLEDRLVWGILTHLDEYARLKGNARTSAAMRQHQKAGRAMSARPPFGFRVVEADGRRRLEPDPERAAEVGRLSELIAGGATLSETARVLNAEFGGRWQATSVRRAAQSLGLR